MALDDEFTFRLVLFRGLTFLLVCPEIIDTVDGGVEVCAKVAHFIICEVEVLPVEVERDILLCRVEQGEGPVATC